jgi:membrane-associated phospholipid phosphatase
MSRIGLALVAFGLVAAFALLPNSHRWEKPVAHWLQGTPPFFHLPAKILTVLGEAWLTIPVVAIVTGLLFLRQRRAAADAAWLLVWLVIGSVIELALKAVLADRSPPGHVYRMYLPLGLSVATASTFPSGHTMRTMLIGRVVLRRFAWLGTGLIVSMMVAVMYLRYHSLSEVLGGLCLGWVLIEAGNVIRTRCCV